MSDKMIGIQLYTVRGECQKDFKGTLRALAEMGYRGVEFAGNYGGMSPADLAAFLHSLGLSAAGMHVSVEDILNFRSDAYAYARALNNTFLTTSLPGEVKKDWPATVDRLVQAAATAYANGFVFTYHNHSEEAVASGGVTALDQALARVSILQFELDTYWLTKGGQNPAAFIRRYTGRAPQIHLKDMDPADSSFAEVGRGSLDMPGIVAAARAAGARWLIVEQDTCKRPSLESARISIEALQRIG